MLDAVLVLVFTVLFVQATYELANLCIFTCPTVTTVPVGSMAAVAGIGAGLVALHVAVAAGVLRGRPNARWVGALLGTLWLIVCVAAVPKMQPGANDGQFVWVGLAFGAITVAICYLPPPPREAR